MKWPIALALAVLALSPTPAMAYLDPGTGSFILQMLIAGFLGAILYVRLAWDRTRLFFTRLFSSLSSRTNSSNEQPKQEDDQDGDRQTPT